MILITLSIIQSSWKIDFYGNDFYIIFQWFIARILSFFSTPYHSVAIECNICINRTTQIWFHIFCILISKHPSSKCFLCVDSFKLYFIKLSDLNLSHFKHRKYWFDPFRKYFRSNFTLFFDSHFKFTFKMFFVCFGGLFLTVQFFF